MIGSSPAVALRWIAAFRMVYGVGALVAPGLTGRLFGLTEHTNSSDARVWRLSFANREIALGALEMFSQAVPAEIRRRLFQGIAAIDAADALAAGYLGRKDPRLRTLIFLAAPFSVASVYLHARAASIDTDQLLTPDGPQSRAVER
jgi:hypothetical protein